MRTAFDRLPLRLLKPENLPTPTAIIQVYAEIGRYPAMSTFVPLHPAETETLSQAEAATLTPLLRGAGLVPLSATGWLRVTGPDRVRWLNGMVTNSIQALKPGESCYSFLLNAQGGIQGDCTAWALPEAVLLETALDRVEAMAALLDRFIIMDDVELTAETGGAGLLLAGPEAAGLLTRLGLAFDAEPMRLTHANFSGASVDVLHAHSPLVPRLELWAAPAVLRELEAALIAAGAVVCTPEALDQLRLLEGTPRFGTDLGERDLPQETALPGTQSRALHFSKGCYLGQEIVERIRSRGQVHRTLSGFLLTGELPAPGTPLNGDDRQQLTSVAAVSLPSGPAQLALGYVRREALERGAPLTYPGGTAVPLTLPFSAALD